MAVRRPHRTLKASKALVNILEQEFLEYYFIAATKYNRNMIEISMKALF